VESVTRLHREDQHVEELLLVREWTGRVRTTRTHLREMSTGEDPGHHVTELGHHVTARSHMGEVQIRNVQDHHEQTELHRLHRRTKPGMGQLKYCNFISVLTNYSLVL